MTTQATEKFEVRNRWTGKVAFTAEIVCAPDASLGVKLGLAVRWGVANGSNLRGSDLSGSDLSGSDLRGSNLSGSNLSYSDLRGSNLSYSDLRGSNLSGSNLRGSDLRGSNLSGSNLGSFKADLWSILLAAKREVPGVIAALKEGRVNGSAYTGECACLVGTIANVRGVDVDTLDQYPNRPAEQWFTMIRTGDRPGDDTGGGFAAGKALEWAEEFQALITA